MTGKRNTRPVRLYEESALVLEELIKRSPPNTTFAEVVESILKLHYPNVYEATVKAQRSITQAAAEDKFSEDKEPEGTPPTTHPVAVPA